MMSLTERKGEIVMAGSNAVSLAPGNDFNEALEIIFIIGKSYKTIDIINKHSK